MQASPLPLQRLQLEESLNGGGAGGGGGGVIQQAAPISPRSLMTRRESHSHVLADISENEALSSEQAVMNVAAMFPTVDEGHIRDLFRK